MAILLTKDYQLINSKVVNTYYKLNLYGKYNSQSIDDTASSITLQLDLVATKSHYARWNSGTSTINNTNSTNMPYNGVGGDYPTTIILNTYTYNVKHNSAGIYENAEVRGKFTTSYSPMKGEVIGNISLPQIPRTSTISSASGYIGEIIPIAIGRKFDSFTDTIRYSFKNTYGTIESKTSRTNINWTIPTSFYDLIPNEPSSALTLYVDTYNGNSLIGTNQTSVTVSVNPNTNKPTLTYNVVETNPKVIALNGDTFDIPILGVSKPKFTITATPQNKATIRSYATSVRNGVIGTTNPYTFSTIPSAYFTISATDSRGISNNVILDRTSVAIPYVLPTIKQSTIQRESPVSSNIIITANGSWFGGKLNNTTSNTFKLFYRYKDITSLSWNPWVQIPSSAYKLNTNNNTWSLTNYKTGEIVDYRNNYNVELALLDSIYDDYSIKVLSDITKGIPTWSEGEHDLAINGELYIADRNGDGKKEIRDLLYPIGCIYISDSNTNPSSKFGGTWELIDKEFKFSNENHDNDQSDTYTINSSNCNSFNMVVVRQGHDILFRFRIGNKVSIGDSTIQFVTVHFDKLGLNDSDGAYGRDVLMYSDGGNGIAMGMFGPTGDIYTTDVVTKTSGGSISANQSLSFTYTWLVPFNRMNDEYCDKFYWKRTR